MPNFSTYRVTQTGHLYAICMFACMFVFACSSGTDGRFPADPTLLHILLADFHSFIQLSSFLCYPDQQARTTALVCDESSFERQWQKHFLDIVDTLGAAPVIAATSAANVEGSGGIAS